MGCDIHIVAEVRKDGVWHLADVEVPDDRNYRTFGILADVRNGRGFAGCDTGDAVKPIDQPRGLPNDMSDELNCRLNDDADEDGEYFWLGDHSFSWLTLKELLDYPYDRMMTIRGMVTKAQAEEFRATGKTPEFWCSWTNQEGHEQLQWEVPMSEGAWLFGKIIDTLKPLGNPDDVRIVFGFDS